MVAAVILIGAPGSGKSATTETDDELRGVLTAASADATLTVCLVASTDAVSERLERREPDRWPGKRTLIADARELATTIPLLRGIDQSIDTTERDAEDVALEIYAQIGINGLASVTR
jgi:hypothetical protein